MLDELYALDPAEFTAARDARAREARGAGNRPLAADIKGLKKPSTAAWTVNILARHRGDDLQHLLSLGDQLRAAQASLSGDEIRALGRQRHQVVTAMARQARALARDRGVNMSDTVEREVTETLEAALADPAAGAAACSGRLVRRLSHAGLEAVDLEGAVAGTPPEPVGSRSAAARTDRGRQSESERRQAEAEAAAAEAEAARASEAVERARARLDQAVAAQAEADSRAADAAATVEQLETQLGEARRAAGEADAASQAAAAEVERARAELGSAEETAGRAAERAGLLRRS